MRTMNQHMRVCTLEAADACSSPHVLSKCMAHGVVVTCVTAPPPPDIRDYCKIIGLDYEKEKSLVHIAVEALKAPLPRDWKPMYARGPSAVVCQEGLCTREGASKNMT